jgi:hypothetical protein
MREVTDQITEHILTGKRYIEPMWKQGMTFFSGHIVVMRDQLTDEIQHTSGVVARGPVYTDFIYNLEMIDRRIVETSETGCRLGECVAEVPREHLVNAIRRGLFAGTHKVEVKDWKIVLNGMVIRSDLDLGNLRIEVEFWKHELEKWRI